MSAPQKALRHPEFQPLDLRNIDLLPWQARAARQALGGTARFTRLRGPLSASRGGDHGSPMVHLTR